MTTIQYALSIAVARWVTPVRPHGLTDDGSTAWELWSLLFTESWSSPITWCPTSRSTDGLEECFRLVDDRWGNKYWEQLLHSAVHYYLDASGGLINRQLVMGASLLELICWHVVVEDRQLLSDKACDRLTSADRLRLLLRLLSVPVEIPPELKALAKKAKQLGWDGPTAVSEVRNAAVHARRHEVGWEWDQEIWLEAALLSEHYCDLAMLGLLGYEGDYINRVSAQYAEDAHPVPWSSRA